MSDDQNGGSGLLVVLAIAIGGLLFATQGTNCRNPIDPTPATGPRTVLILYETSNVTPQFQITLTKLRVGKIADELTSKKHELTILDDDLALPTNASQSLKNAATKAKEVGPPAIVVVDSSSGSVTGSAKLELTASAETVAAFIASHGGG